MMEIRNATPVALSISPLFFSRSHFRFGRKGTERETERVRQRTERERVNPESHGNLATSAIGRTCTRSNLKARSRTREKERERGPFFHSYARNALRTYARWSHSSTARCFLFAVRHLRRELEAPPGTPSGSTFIVNEGPPSLRFRLRRPHRSFAYIRTIPPGLPVITPDFVIACDFAKGRTRRPTLLEKPRREKRVRGGFPTSLSSDFTQLVPFVV